MTETATDYDSPWKGIIERYFEAFMAFFFPQAHEAIDWTKGYTFLDKELQQVVREAETGPRRVDKLVQVTPKGSEETAWVLIHVEVQGQRDNDFPERIYIYNYRLYDRYQRQVASMAILSDTSPNWRPQSFGYDLFGCRVSLDFPAVKLLDYGEIWDALEADTNPFAVVVMAHLQTQRTQQQPAERYAAKLKLAQMLYRRGYIRQDVLELFRFLDWILTLPTELEQQFRVELAQFEAEVKMEYVTSVERLAMEEGREEGRQEGSLEKARQFILAVLNTRFGASLETAAHLVEQIDDLNTLDELHRQAVTIDSLAAFERLLNEDAEP
jgi:predicted transposase YdaD